MLGRKLYYLYRYEHCKPQNSDLSKRSTTRVHFNKPDWYGLVYDPTQLAKEKTEDEFDQTYLANGFTCILSSVL